MKKRTCIRCKKQIGECMGFVIARDILANKQFPRELCDQCGFIALEMPDKILEVMKD